VAKAHRIRRLRWRVRAGSRDAAFEVRARLRQLHQADLLDVFERAFDAAGTGDTIVHLPRLELAVTVPNIDEIGAALAQALALKTVWDTPPRAAPRAAIDDRSPRVTTEHAPAGIDGLLDYLRSGILPWPLANLGRTATRDELIRLAVEHRDRVAADIPASLDDAVAFVFRWLQVTPSAEWTAIARLVGGPPPAADVIAPLAVLAAIAAGSGPSLPRSVAPGAVAAAILAVAHLDRRAAPIAVPQLASLFALIVPIAGSAPSDALVIARALLPGAVATWITARLADVTVESTARLPRTGSTEAPPASAHPTPPASVHPAPPDAAVRSPEVLLPVPHESPERDTPPHDDDHPGLVVDHAGLVVLHPFLPRLFERLGVAPHGARAIDPALLPRAAALLAYAALGDDNPLDFELGLIKVLLGLRPVAVVLTPAGTLSDADREEVDALLHSVIEHWQVLKHTSIAGLRGSFLQRRGLLTAIDGSWRLRVEPDSFDMLIDQLPWALGPVKLPWMTTLLFTEWARS
jgi:hypothetical protein